MSVARPTAMWTFGVTFLFTCPSVECKQTWRQPGNTQQVNYVITETPPRVTWNADDPAGDRQRARGSAAAADGRIYRLTSVRSSVSQFIREVRSDDHCTRPPDAAAAAAAKAKCCALTLRLPRSRARLRRSRAPLSRISFSLSRKCCLVRSNRTAIRQEVKHRPPQPGSCTQPECV